MPNVYVGAMALILHHVAQLLTSEEFRTLPGVSGFHSSPARCRVVYAWPKPLVNKIYFQASWRRGLRMKTVLEEFCCTWNSDSVCLLIS